MYALSRDVTAPGVVVYDSGLCLCVSAFNGSRTRRSPRLTIKVGWIIGGIEWHEGSAVGSGLFCPVSTIRSLENGYTASVP